MSVILPQSALGPAAALRAIANKLERGEIRSYYVVVVDAKSGKSRNTIYLNPATGDADVEAIGGAMCDTIDRLTAHVEASGRISAPGRAN